MKLSERTKTVLSGVIFAGILIATFLIRLLNPLMTETQLLVNFWWVWVIEVVLAMGSVLLLR